MPDISNETLDLGSVLTPEELRRFRPSWWRILVYLLAGWSQTKTAEQLGIHANTISRLWNDEPSFRKAFNFLNSSRQSKATKNFSEVSIKTDELSIRALQILSDIMDDESAPPSVRSSNARDILHIAGHKPKERIEVESTRPIVIGVSDPGFRPEDDPYIAIQKRLGLKSTTEEAFSRELEDDLSRLDGEDDVDTEL